MSGDYCVNKIRRESSLRFIQRPAVSFVKLRVSFLIQVFRSTELYLSFQFPDIEYAHFVIQRVNYNLTETLFELNALLGKRNTLHQH